MKRSLHYLFLLMLLVSGSARADILVLIHGYLSDANVWETTGINDVLAANGWQRAGLFVGSAQGPQLFVKSYNEKGNKVYVANLPFEAPVDVQTDALNQILSIIRQRHKNEKIILAGHSAGGLIARAVLVKYPPNNIRALITIASPHLGTYRAYQALKITRNDGPFDLIKRFIGGNDYVSLKHSRVLMADLLPAHPGSFLDWLNQQTHPNIPYVSIIRTNPQGIPGDSLVPGYSQDMNNVPALHGKSAVMTTPTSHYLTHDDAFTLLDVLKKLDTVPEKSLPKNTLKEKQS